jgi:hypothetical protein
MRTLNEVEVQESDFRTISLPVGMEFPHGGSKLLVTAIYHTFWQLLSDDDEDWQNQQTRPQPHAFPSHATVIKGQPGVGECMDPFTYLCCVR